jgi:hypothetical protein
VRLAGTSNYKAKYAPSFPTVSIVSTVCGRVVTPEQLNDAGLLAAPEPIRATPLRVSSSRSWPDYDRCVQGAPMNRDKTGGRQSRGLFFLLDGRSTGKFHRGDHRAPDGVEQQG